MTPRGDDAPHPPGAHPWWSEAWHLDAAAADGTGLTVRLECYPNQNVAWFWAYLVRPDLPGPVVVRDHEVPLPRQGLEIRSEGLWADLWCETPMEHWTYGLEAFGLRLDDPAAAVGVGQHGEIGERLPIGLDIEWEVRGPTHERPDASPVAGFVQSGVVHGDVLLERARVELDCFGERRHTWGVRDWGVRDSTRESWHVAGAADDLTFHVAGPRPVDGFVWRGGQAAEPVTSARSEVRFGTDGLPLAARIVVDDRVEIEIDVLGLAPVPLPGATLARAVCRYAIDATTAFGWSSWLVPRA